MSDLLPQIVETLEDIADSLRALVKLHELQREKEPPLAPLPTKSCETCAHMKIVQSYQVCGLGRAWDCHLKPPSGEYTLWKPL